MRSPSHFRPPRLTHTRLTHALRAPSPKLLQLISDELAELKQTYGNKRRTKIGRAGDADLSEMDLTANEACIIIKSVRGYMKRLPLDEFEAQQRGTRGKAGMTNLRDDDAVKQVINCNAHDTSKPTAHWDRSLTSISNHSPISSTCVCHQ